MVLQSDLVAYLDDYLAIDAFSDGIWNGLQVEGKPEICKVVFAVDAGLETFQKAAEAHGDMLIVHHGHFLKSLPPTMTAWSKKRLSFLLDHTLSLYAAHLPLDAHPEVGNNAQLFDLIGCSRTKPFAFFGSKNISWIGELQQPRGVDELAQELNNTLSTHCKILPFGPKTIKRVAICSGGGGYKLVSQAVEAGVDLFITGDTVEVYHLAKDAGIHVIFAGHYATETVGIKALQKHLAAYYDIETLFIDVPTRL